MIMSSDPSAHHRLNQEVASKHRLLDLIRRPDFATLLTEFAYEWDSGHYNQGCLVLNAGPAFRGLD